VAVALITAAGGGLARSQPVFNALLALAGRLAQVRRGGLTSVDQR